MRLLVHLLCVHCCPPTQPLIRAQLGPFDDDELETLVASSVLGPTTCALPRNYQSLPVASRAWDVARRGLKVLPSTTPLVGDARSYVKAGEEDEYMELWKARSR